MKQRAKERGDAIAPALLEFASFLETLGPIPHPGYTLDQINREKKIYSAENAEWADKTTQANNRSNTIRILWEGQPVPIAEVARRTGQSADTLRRRFQRGWSEAEIVNGRPARPQRGPRVPPIIRRPKEAVDNFALARWLEDEAEIEAWLGMYFGEDETAFGSYAYNEERLSFLDFVYQQSEKSLETWNGGDDAHLIPPLRSLKELSPEDRAVWLERLSLVNFKSFKQMLRDRFQRDTLVDKRTLDRSIDIEWHNLPRPDDPDYRVRYTACRKAIASFQREGKTLPPVLAEFLREMGGRRMM